MKAKYVILSVNRPGRTVSFLTTLQNGEERLSNVSDLLVNDACTDCGGLDLNGEPRSVPCTIHVNWEDDKAIVAAIEAYVQRYFVDAPRGPDRLAGTERSL